MPASPTQREPCAAHPPAAVQPQSGCSGLVQTPPPAPRPRPQRGAQPRPHGLETSCAAGHGTAVSAPEPADDEASRPDRRRARPLDPIGLDPIGRSERGQATSARVMAMDRRGSAERATPPRQRPPEPRQPAQAPHRYPAHAPSTAPARDHRACRPASKTAPDCTAPRVRAARSLPAPASHWRRAIPRAGPGRRRHSGSARAASTNAPRARRAPTPRRDRR